MKTLYRLERAPQANSDIRSVLRFLIQSHVRFGASFAEAKERAGAKLREIRAAMNHLAVLAHQGTRHLELIPGLRSVTKDRVIFYFIVDDEARIVRVLAVFFGGQDHQRAMLKRLGSGR